jgi:hypothetical protein
MNPTLPTALVLALAATLAATPAQAAEIPDPVYCWNGIAGSECGVLLAGCQAATGNNYVTETSYTYARCHTGPLAGCIVYLANGVPTTVKCGPVEA